MSFQGFQGSLQSAEISFFVVQEIAPHFLYRKPSGGCTGLFHERNCRVTIQMNFYQDCSGPNLKV